jgi:hypothetical protein
MTGLSKCGPWPSMAVEPGRKHVRLSLPVNGRAVMRAGRDRRSAAGLPRDAAPDVADPRVGRRADRDDRSSSRSLPAHRPAVYAPEGSGRRIRPQPQGRPASRRRRSRITCAHGAAWRRSPRSDVVRVRGAVDSSPLRTSVAMHVRRRRPCPGTGRLTRSPMSPRRRAPADDRNGRRPAAVQEEPGPRR